MLHKGFLVDLQKESAAVVLDGTRNLPFCIRGRCIHAIIDATVLIKTREIYKKRGPYPCARPSTLRSGTTPWLQAE